MNDLRKRFAKCSSFEIDLRLHVIHFRLVSEGISQSDVEADLNDLKNLDFNKLLSWKQEDKHKFILYFQHSRNITYKYVIDIRDGERKIRVVTVHKIHHDSQEWFEKHARR